MLTTHNLVIARIVESYDVNYGVRSVVNEVHRIAVQLLAEAHIRGEIKNKYVYGTVRCIQLLIVPTVVHSWLVHLCSNTLGDIDIETADPKGE